MHLSTKAKIEGATCSKKVKHSGVQRHTKGAARFARRALCVEEHRRKFRLLVGSVAFIFLSAQAAAQVKSAAFFAKCAAFDP